jgi:hypothetical protein
MRLIAERIGGGQASVTWEGSEKAILTVGDKRIEVHKEEILVDGVPKAKIPPGTNLIGRGATQIVEGVSQFPVAPLK